MKRAIQFAICVLAALLAVEPCLAAAQCGDRAYCGSSECGACCGQMKGMTAAMGAMQRSQDEQRTAMVDRGRASAMDCERDSNCSRAEQNPSRYLVDRDAISESMLAALTGDGLVAMPAVIYLPQAGRSQDARARERFLLFRVFRI